MFSRRDAEWLVAPGEEASVVATLHLCPVGDPILFLWLLKLESEIELIPLGLANFHPLVLWHYAVVDRSLEEPELVGEARERGRQLTLERRHFSSGRAELNGHSKWDLGFRA